MSTPQRQRAQVDRHTVQLAMPYPGGPEAEDAAHVVGAGDAVGHNGVQQRIDTTDDLYCDQQSPGSMCMM